MAKMTVLEMVQNIASALESDDVNSISDTIEAYQIAREIQTAYFLLVSALNIPTNDGLVLLDGLADTSRPNYLVLPPECKSIKWFKYDNRSQGTAGDYQEVSWLEPEDFVLRVVQNAGVGSTTLVTDFSGAQLTIKTDKNPQYWTSFDNQHIVTDSYNSALDDTLHQFKTLCFGENYNTFTIEDSFIPVLDDNLFPLLLADAKSACFFNIKQMPNPKEEKRASQQLIRAQNDLSKASPGKARARLPDYGRSRAGRQSSIRFRP
jgi:hypothetical protein